MNKIKSIFINISKTKKIFLSVLIISIGLIISSLIPTLAEFIYGDGTIKTSVWDGTVASSFRTGDGTKENPYVISNGSELAYFSYKLKDTNYINNYIEISNNIILNEGILKYNVDGIIEYQLDDIVYYVEPYTNRYYDNLQLEGIPAGTLNIFPSLNSFEGNFIGNNKTIYGLYITSNEAEELALFTNLKGNTNNLYIKNSLVYGGIKTSGFASSTENANLENIFVDGYVIGKQNDIEKTVTKDFISEEINIYNYETTNYLDLSDLIPFIGGVINSSKITGNYILETPEQTNILINNTEVSGGTFEIDLGRNLLDELPVITSTTLANNKITFSNLKYIVNYNYGISGGLIGDAKNTVIKMSVNKSDVYGKFTSSGIIANAASNVSISSSYNTGNISSDVISAGIIGTSLDNASEVIINNSFNKGEINSLYSAGLISVIINSANLSLNNVFNISNNNLINKIDGSLVNINNGYYTEDTLPIGSGNANGEFVKVLKEELNNKEFLINNLYYNEYVNEENLVENPDNVWVYNDDVTLSLYYDEEISKTVNIYIGNNIYNNYSKNINNMYLNKNIVFTVDGINNFTPITKVEYYLSESETIMNIDELDFIDSWQLFNQIQQINDENTYVIYFKITDYKNRITYINTDHLILDLTNPEVIIKNESNEWNTLNNNPNNYYISKAQEFNIDTTDELSGMTNSSYLISNILLSEEELENNEWITYEDNIVVDELGKYIIYVKASDNSGNTKYINSDFINYDGFIIESLSIGFDNKYNYGDIPVNITNNSSITLKSNLTINYFDDIDNYLHYLNSNILLPVGTKINIINHNNNKIYTYKVDTELDEFGYYNSCDELDIECEKVASYPFSLFSEIGVSNNVSYLENLNILDNQVLENYTIIIDFMNATVSTSIYDINLYLELLKNSTNRISTLENSYKKFNVYSKDEFSSKLSLTSDYSGTNIEFNTDSITQINLSSELNHYIIGDTKIIDTTIENKKTGLLISFIDSDGFIVNKKHFKNIIFKLNNNIHNPGTDNLIKTKINNSENIILDIITTESKTELKEGTYYIKINNFISADGNHIGSLGNDEIIIPVVVANNSYEINHGFNVIFGNTLPIINKNDIYTQLNLNILRTGYLNNPNIRISLYEKAQLTAYNQDYLLVDLNSYIEEDLELINNNIYYLTKNNADNISLSLKFKNNLIKYNGYKIVFELFDDNRKIDSIKKYLIAR